MIDIRFDILERRNNGDCDGIVVVEVVLVLLVEEDDAVVEAMENGSDTMKEY